MSYFEKLYNKVNIPKSQNKNKCLEDLNESYMNHILKKKEAKEECSIYNCKNNAIKVVSWANDYNDGRACIYVCEEHSKEYEQDRFAKIELIK